MEEEADVEMQARRGHGDLKRAARAWLGDTWIAPAFDIGGYGWAHCVLLYAPD